MESPSKASDVFLHFSRVCKCALSIANVKAGCRKQKLAGPQETVKDNLLKIRTSTVRPARGAPAPVRGTVSSEKPSGRECPQHTVLASEERGVSFSVGEGLRT